MASRSPGIVLLALIVAACSEPAREPDSTLLSEPLPRPSFERLEVEARGHLENERSRLENELAASPESASLLADLGGLYLAHGFDSAAASVFERAAQIDTTSFRSIYLHGVSLQRARRLQEASGALNLALDLRPGDLPSLLRAGRMALELGELDSSRKHYQLALEIASDTAEAWFGIGTIALQDGTPEEAVDALEKALELDPEATAIHSPLAQALSRIGEADRAREHLELAGTVRPYFADPLFDELGGLLAGPRVHIAQGDRAMASGRVDAAIAHYRRAAELAPENAKAHHNLGAALGRSGAHDEGLEHLRLALDLDPELPDAKFDLSSALANLGRIEEALAIDPTRVEIRSVLALSWLQQGRDREAEVLLLEAPSRSHAIEATLARLRAVATDPSVRAPETALVSARQLFAERSSPELGMTVALALEACGRHEEAVHWLEQLIESAGEAGVPEDVLEPLRHYLSYLRAAG